VKVCWKDSVNQTYAYITIIFYRESYWVGQNLANIATNPPGCFSFGSHIETDQPD